MAIVARGGESTMTEHKRALTKTELESLIAEGTADIRRPGTTGVEPGTKHGLGVGDELHPGLANRADRTDQAMPDTGRGSVNTPTVTTGADGSAGLT